MDHALGGRNLGAACGFGKLSVPQGFAQKGRPGRSPARAFDLTKRRFKALDCYAALLRFEKLSLIGSAVLVATDWAFSANSLACAVIVSNCERI